MHDTDIQPTDQHAGPATSDEHNYLHIRAGGRIRALLTRLLRRVPSTLCGQSLLGDPDRLQPHPCSPICPACVEVSGLTENELGELTEFVPSYWT